MSHPSTYLLTSPSETDKLGTHIMSGELLRRLKLLNPGVYHIERYSDRKDPHGRPLGTTSLWVRRRDGTSHKITAFNAGPIPEYTQLGPDGRIIVKGWRAILDRCIAMRVATEEQLARAFNTTLTVDKHNLGNFCRGCLKTQGRMVRVSGANKLCRLHQGVVDNVKRGSAKQDEVSYKRYLDKGPEQPKRRLTLFVNEKQRGARISR